LPEEPLGVIKLDASSREAGQSLSIEMVMAPDIALQ